jgi:hypothetical protein
MLRMMMTGEADTFVALMKVLPLNLCGGHANQDGQSNTSDLIQSLDCTSDREWPWDDTVFEIG